MNLFYQHLIHADHLNLGRAYTNGVTFKHERVIDLFGVRARLLLTRSIWRFTSLDLGFDFKKD
jgi:hypothetical protein